MNHNQPYEEVTVPAGANQKKKTLADVLQLSQWVYEHATRLGLGYKPELSADYGLMRAKFAVYQPSQNPDDAEMLIWVQVEVDMEGDWQTFLYYMVLDDLKRYCDYAGDLPAAACGAQLECEVPKHCHLLTLDEARAVRRNGYLSYEVLDGSPVKYDVQRPAPLLGTPYYVVAQHMGRDNALRLLLITREVMQEVYSV